jgi:hypothetical protein
MAVVFAILRAAGEAFADHRTHRAAHERELEAGHHARQRVNRAAHDDHGVGFVGFFHRLFQAVRVLAAVLELEGVDRQDFLADFVAAFRIEQTVEPLTCADAHVMVALGANMQIGLDVVAVQNRFARRALDPQPFRNAFTALRIGLLDFRRQQFVEPAHVDSFVGLRYGRRRDEPAAQHTADKK